MGIPLTLQDISPPSKHPLDCTCSTTSPPPHAVQFHVLVSEEEVIFCKIETLQAETGQDYMKIEQSNPTPRQRQIDFVFAWIDTVPHLGTSLLHRDPSDPGRGK